MRLATVDAVIEAGAIPNVSESVRTTVAAHLDASFSLLLALIETRLDAVSGTDWFRIPEHELSDYPLRLRLTNGFVDPDSVTVMVSDNSGGITAALTGSAYSEYSLDHVRGILEVHAPVLPGVGTVTVHYDSGFNVDQDDVAQRVPQELRQAAVFAALSSFNAGTPSSAVRKGSGGVYKASNEAYTLMRSALLSLLRPRMAVLYSYRFVPDD